MVGGVGGWGVWNGGVWGWGGLKFLESALFSG